ncbi:lytic transglycosylase domain-containing protein [Xylanivirga thermophila]|uniref:lytic transglycosylase domain-containing protein n=1 Tax=Xylanivirga thermophila TaxID=2496273 RepID=UPI00101BC125|nr:lytic transglycosylase domain-containing protein [Xylanivirga thermophila]
MQKVLRMIKYILLFTTLALICIYAVYNSSWFQRKIYPLNYKDYIVKYSEEYELDPYLVMSVIWAESRFEPSATSHKGAAGLMQLMPDTAKWAAKKMGMKDYSDEIIYQPEVNIRLGCWYLNNLSRQFDGNVELMLAAYNGGSGNVRKWLGNKQFSADGQKLDNIPFEETKNYVSKVLNVYNRYKKLYRI